MPISFRSFRTTTFRLSALYLLLFAISSLAVFGYIYYNTIGLLERQNDQTIEAEVTGLADQYRTGGLPALILSVERRMSGKPDMLFMLADPKGAYLTGNLHSPPINDMPDNSWIDFPIGQGDKNTTMGHVARGFNIQLPQDYQLIVGLDVDNLRQFREGMQRSLFWGLGIALLLGAFGGLAMSRNFTRRVADITGTSRIIMRGDFSGRIPISGSGDEMDQLSQSLNEMLDQIEKLMQGMREVSSNVAHDLRTPLTRLRARIEAALRQDNKSAHKAALHEALVDSESLLATFNALLSIAQMEAGQMRSGLEVFDAHDVLADVVDLYAPLAEDNEGGLSLAAPQGLMVRARKELLAQALTNLIDNAMKYGAGAAKGAIIRVSGAKTAGEIVLAVEDSGAGIPAKDRERVLQRFVRLDESRSKPGNGLGLSLVASVASLLGGKLLLTDNAPGLRAELRLPLAAVSK